MTTAAELRCALAEARDAFDALRTSRIPLLSLAIAAVCVAFAVVERRAAPAFALDRALLGTTFGLFVPLGCLALTKRLFPDTLEAAVVATAQFGADRRTALLGRIVVMLAAQATLATLLGLGTILAAGGTAPLASELLAQSWIAPLAAAGHGAIQLFGSSFGRHGAVVALALDWVLGSLHGPLALPWPRGHARNLLGGETVLQLTQGQSALALAIISLLAVASAVYRTER